MWGVYNSKIFNYKKKCNYIKQNRINVKVSSKRSIYQKLKLKILIQNNTKFKKPYINSFKIDVDSDQISPFKRLVGRGESSLGTKKDNRDD